MSVDSLKKLYIEELKDLYSAETQLTKALPKMSKEAGSGELKQAFEDHLEQTREHVRRIEEIMKDLGEDPKGKKCQGMEALIEEAEEMIAETEEAVKDAAMIAAAQKVEHYEMAGYGTVRTYAEMLGFENAVQTLQTTLDEEKEADERLTQIAETSVNLEAAAQA